MIPNIFISSTIADLQYLRDGLRDAVADLAYNPVMSEFGEVGYISPSTAAVSCYRTVRQCQMMVLIIGKRYGEPSNDGFSVTHREFLTAREHSIPTITFIESQVLVYKEVYDADRTAAIWNSFSPMDRPHKTFAFIDDVKSSEIYNGLVAFGDVSEAKRKLKLQIADFVGERLSKTIGPLRDDLRDVLAEIKTIRNQLMHQPGQTEKSREKSSEYLKGLRFLLDDRQAEYRKFLEAVFGDIDAALPVIVSAPDLEMVLKAADLKFSLLDDKDEFDRLLRGANADKRGKHTKYAVMSLRGWYVVYSDRSLILSSSMLDSFRNSQRALKLQLEI